MPTRRAPQTITLLSDLIVSRSQPVSSVSVWTLSPLDRLVRLCSWVYLNREHYQQLMRTTWPIRDCSKVVCLFINILQNSRLPISSQLYCQFQARLNYFRKLFCEIFREVGTYSRDGRTMQTRRAPQTITLLSDLIVSRSQPVSSVSVWTLSPLDRLVRLCSWVYLNREHYQQLMRTTWPIHDWSKVVSLLIFFQNSRLSS